MRYECGKFCEDCGNFNKIKRRIETLFMNFQRIHREKLAENKQLW